jgi:hypothetical protein
VPSQKGRSSLTKAKNKPIDEDVEKLTKALLSVDVADMRVSGVATHGMVMRGGCCLLYNTWQEMGQRYIDIEIH